MRGESRKLRLGPHFLFVVASLFAPNSCSVHPYQVEKRVNYHYMLEFLATFTGDMPRQKELEARFALVQ